jgi:hypothetical protein
MRVEVKNTMANRGTTCASIETPAPTWRVGAHNASVASRYCRYQTILERQQALFALRPAATNEVETAQTAYDLLSPSTSHAGGSESADIRCAPPRPN